MDLSLIKKMFVNLIHEYTLYIVAILLLLFGIQTAEAHNPLTARFDLVVPSNNDVVTLKLYLTQLGVHKALEKQYPEINFEDVEVSDYKRMVIDYLRLHIFLKADDVILELGTSAIKLGHHETDVIFFIKNYPNKVITLDVAIDAFSENGNQQSVFRWITQEKDAKVVLSHRNEFSMVLGKKKNINTSNFSFSIWVFLVLIPLISIVTFVFRQHEEIKNILNYR